MLLDTINAIICIKNMALGKVIYTSLLIIYNKKYDNHSEKYMLLPEMFAKTSHMHLLYRVMDVMRYYL